MKQTSPNVFDRSFRLNSDTWLNVRNVTKSGFYQGWTVSIFVKDCQVCSSIGKVTLKECFSEIRKILKNLKKVFCSGNDLDRTGGYCRIRNERKISFFYSRFNGNDKKNRWCCTKSCRVIKHRNDVEYMISIMSFGTDMRGKYQPFEMDTTITIYVDSIKELRFVLGSFFDVVKKVKLK